MFRMYHSQIFHHVRNIDRKHCKAAVFVACGVVGIKIIVNTVQKFNRRKKIQQRQEEVKEACARLRQQLQNDGMTSEKSDAITGLSITELQRKLQNEELKAMEVLKAYQYKALEANERTNCMVEPIKEAEALARALDNQKGSKGPLHGIPISIKESYNIKGYDVTGGFSYFLRKPVNDDAVLVKAVRAAGGVPFVRTNIPQTMMTFGCSNPIYGVTTNPHDSTRGPGGSSGGEAAIIGAGASILGLGSDIGGSIRIPSHMCGVAGLKPTVQRLSLDGLFDLGRGQTNVIPAAGPIARNVDGLVLAMKSLLDKTLFDLDPFVPPLPFNNQLYESKKRLRIGYYTYDGIIHAVPACVRAVNEAKAALERMGHTVVPFSPPGVYRAISRLFVPSINADHGDTFVSYLRHDEVDKNYFAFYFINRFLPYMARKILGLLVKLKDPLIGDALLFNRVLYTVDWWSLNNKIRDYKSLFLQEWRSQQLDAVICPGFACHALPSGREMEVTSAVTYTTFYNLVNFPAGSVPVTKVTQQDQQNMNNEEVFPAKTFSEKHMRHLCQDGEGLPVNVQCVALPFQEEVVLRLMKDIESNI